MNERTIRLQGDEQITVRPMTAGDAGAVRAAFDHLSPASLRSRFFTPMPRLPRGVAADLTLVDDRRIVLLALDDAGEVIGEARAVRLRDDPATAEVAVTVGDQHQHRGVGRALMRVLRREAERAGIVRLTGHILTDNVAAQALLLRGDATASFAEPGVLGFEIPLGRRGVAAANRELATMGLAS
jgi:GNAT superfamily N-acetyltransferase